MTISSSTMMEQVPAPTTPIRIDDMMAQCAPKPRMSKADSAKISQLVSGVTGIESIALSALENVSNHKTKGADAAGDGAGSADESQDKLKKTKKTPKAKRTTFSKDAEGSEEHQDPEPIMAGNRTISGVLHNIWAGQKASALPEAVVKQREGKEDPAMSISERLHMKADTMKKVVLMRRAKSMPEEEAQNKVSESPKMVTGEDVSKLSVSERLQRKTDTMKKAVLRCKCMEDHDDGNSSDEDSDDGRRKSAFKGVEKYQRDTGKAAVAVADALGISHPNNLHYDGSGSALNVVISDLVTNKAMKDAVLLCRSGKQPTDEDKTEETIDTTEEHEDDDDATPQKKEKKMGRRCKSMGEGKEQEESKNTGWKRIGRRCKSMGEKEEEGDEDEKETATTSRVSFQLTKNKASTAQKTPGRPQTIGRRSKSMGEAENNHDMDEEDGPKSRVSLQKNRPSKINRRCKSMGEHEEDDTKGRPSVSTKKNQKTASPDFNWAAKKKDGLSQSCHVKDGNQRRRGIGRSRSMQPSRTSRRVAGNDETNKSKEDDDVIPRSRKSAPLRSISAEDDVLPKNRRSVPKRSISAKGKRETDDDAAMARSSVPARHFSPKRSMSNRKLGSMNASAQAAAAAVTAADRLGLLMGIETSKPLPTNPRDSRAKNRSTKMKRGNSGGSSSGGGDDDSCASDGTPEYPQPRNSSRISTVRARRSHSPVRRTRSMSPGPRNKKSASLSPSASSRTSGVVASADKTALDFWEQSFTCPEEEYDDEEEPETPVVRNGRTGQPMSTRSESGRKLDIVALRMSLTVDDGRGTKEETRKPRPRTSQSKRSGSDPLK